MFSLQSNNMTWTEVEVRYLLQNYEQYIIEYGYRFFFPLSHVSLVYLCFLLIFIYRALPFPPVRQVTDRIDDQRGTYTVYGRDPVGEKNWNTRESYTYDVCKELIKLRVKRKLVLHAPSLKETSSIRRPRSDLVFLKKQNNCDIYGCSWKRHPLEVLSASKLLFTPFAVFSAYVSFQRVQRPTFSRQNQPTITFLRTCPALIAPEGSTITRAPKRTGQDSLHYRLKDSTHKPGTLPIDIDYLS